jgi:quercetin dioxygenase-like cupin family protein
LVKDNPYIDTNNTRTFSKDVDKMSLIWHTDQEDRTVTVLEGKGWQFQRDNELPLVLTEGVRIFIPKGQIHRVIKGQTDLKLKIEK